MKKLIYKGTLEQFTRNEIYLNVNSLKRGKYDLKITLNDKVIMKTHFTRE